MTIAPAARLRPIFAAACAAACSSASIAAVIAYDHLIAASSTIAPANVELAEYVTLGTGPATLDSARFRLSYTTPGAYSGTLVLSFYSDAAGAPGSLLASYTQPVIVGSTTTFANFSSLGLSVPGSVWVSTRFVSTSTLAGVRLSLSAPSVGSVATTRAIRAGGSGSWTTTPGVDRWMEMSLTAIPTPGAASLLLLATAIAARRRRSR